MVGMQGEIREIVVWLPCRERTKCPFEDLAALCLAKGFKWIEAITDAPIDWKIYLLIQQTFAGQRPLQDMVLHPLSAETNTNRMQASGHATSGT